MNNMSDDVKMVVYCANLLQFYRQLTKLGAGGNFLCRVISGSPIDSFARLSCGILHWMVQVTPNSLAQVVAELDADLW
jgi:hypothetical protein